MKKKFLVDLQRKNQHENPQSAQGTVIHFQNLTEEDIEYVQPLILDKQDTQSKEINQNVHIIFNQTYKFISVFASEQTYHDQGLMYLGKNSDVECNLTGDIIQNAYFQCVLPKIVLPTSKRFGYCTNLGCSMISAICKIGTSNTAVDYVNSQTNIILNNLFKRKDQRFYFNNLQGNTPAQTSLKNIHDSYKIVVPLKMFFSDNPQRSFRKRHAGVNKIIFNVDLKKIEDLICYTQNLQEDIDNDYFLKYNQLQKSGILIQEIYLSEQEQMLQQGSFTQLIEQNLVVRNTITEQTQKFVLSTFSRPTKFIYLAVQKQKYTQKLPYLAYMPVIEGYEYTNQLIEEATKRFVLKFSCYQVEVPKSGVTAYTDATKDDITTVDTRYVKISGAGVKEFYNTVDFENQRTFLTEAVTNYFRSLAKKPVDGVMQLDFTKQPGIKSIFDQTDGLVGLVDQNKKVFDIEKVFNDALPQFLNSKTKFITQNVIILGNYLTIEQASYPIDNKNINTNSFKKHIPDNINTYAAQTTGAKGQVVKFSMFMEDIEIDYFTTVAAQVQVNLGKTMDLKVDAEYYSVSLSQTPFIVKDIDGMEITVFPTRTVAYTAPTITANATIQFLNLTLPMLIKMKIQNGASLKDSYIFNDGSNGNDIIVQQHDNFGKNIDGSGEVLLNVELNLSQNQVFKISGIDMKNQQILSHFPGRTHGASVYSFSLNPDLIQPTGSLSFSEMQAQIQIQSLNDHGDQILIGTQIYNMLEYSNGNFRVAFAAQIGSE